MTTIWPNSIRQFLKGAVPQRIGWTTQRSGRQWNSPVTLWAVHCWHASQTPPLGTAAAVPPGWTVIYWWVALLGCTMRRKTEALDKSPHSETVLNQDQTKTLWDLGMQHVQCSSSILDHAWSKSKFMSTVNHFFLFLFSCQRRNRGSKTSTYN